MMNIHIQGMQVTKNTEAHENGKLDSKLLDHDEEKLLEIE